MKSQLILEVYRLFYQMIKLIKAPRNDLWNKLKFNEPMNFFYNELSYYYSNIGNNTKAIIQIIVYLLKIISQLLLGNNNSFQQLNANSNYITFLNELF